MNRSRLGAVLGLALAAGLSILMTAASATGTAKGAPIASSWTLVKFVQPQPACTGAGFQGAQHYSRLECGFGYFKVSVDGASVAPTTPAVVKVTFLDGAGNALQTQTATARTTAGSEGWQFTIQPKSTWPAGPVTIRASDVDTDGAGPQPNQHGDFGDFVII